MLLSGTTVVQYAAGLATDSADLATVLAQVSELLIFDTTWVPSLTLNVGDRCYRIQLRKAILGQIPEFVLRGLE